MKQPDARLFDDLARMAGGAVNLFASLREQIAQDIRARVEDMAAQMDLIPREDFDRLSLQVEALQKRVDALEAKSENPPRVKSSAPQAAKKTTVKTKKPASGKTSGKKRA